MNATTDVLVHVMETRTGRRLTIGELNGDRMGLTIQRNGRPLAAVILTKAEAIELAMALLRKDQK